MTYIETTAEKIGEVILVTLDEENHLFIPKDIATIEKDVRLPLKGAYYDIITYPVGNLKNKLYFKK